MAKADELPKMEWSRETQCLLVPNGGYGRMCRLVDGTILACAQVGGSLWYCVAQITRKLGALPSLFVLDAEHVIALTSATIGERRGLWSVKGRVVSSR